MRLPEAQPRRAAEPMLFVLVPKLGEQPRGLPVLLDLEIQKSLAVQRVGRVLARQFVRRRVFGNGLFYLTQLAQRFREKKMGLMREGSRAHPPL